MAAGAISISWPKKTMRPCSTVCHFEMASLGSRVVAPERRTIANRQLKTFKFTIRCFLWSKVSSSIVKGLFLQQAFWEYKEFGSKKTFTSIVEYSAQTEFEFTHARMLLHCKLVERWEEGTSSFWSYCTTTVPLSKHWLNGPWWPICELDSSNAFKRFHDRTTNTSAETRLLERHDIKGKHISGPLSSFHTMLITSCL